ncbi:cyclic nucleotide-binding domain-containing protein [Rhizobium helianthi]|uniref:Cyclic nucleotide-binding domain-containing protein n=1 Tax=Rhizobium helianthi TaxID=1132695 RepID=A0ABW4M227_9HYPH
MLLKEEVELLRKVPYFNRVEPCKLKLLAFASQRVSYQPGECLFREGEASDAAYVVLDGSVELAPLPADAEAGCVGVSGMLGEMCLLSDQPRRSTAIARTPVEVLKIGRDCLLKLVSDNPRMSFEISRVLAQSLRDRFSEGASPLRFSAR